MNAVEVSDAIWKQVEPSVYISKREFFAALDGWTITPREIDGEVVGATMECGPEFHFITFKFKKSFPASLMIECVQPIIDKHGFVLTKTPKDDVRQRRFNVLVGFHAYSEDQYYIYYRLEKLQLHKAKTCQS